MWVCFVSPFVRCLSAKYLWSSFECKLQYVLGSKLCVFALLDAFDGFCFVLPQSCLPGSSCGQIGNVGGFALSHNSHNSCDSLCWQDDEWLQSGDGERWHEWILCRVSWATRKYVVQLPSLYCIYYCVCLYSVGTWTLQAEAGYGFINFIIP
jgi:hypothetical protein